MAGLNKGGMDTFIENLPGFPDNIRRSSSGGYWVAMSAIRPNPGFSMLDFLSQRPWIKNLIFKVGVHYICLPKLEAPSLNHQNASVNESLNFKVKQYCIKELLGPLSSVSECFLFFLSLQVFTGV